MITYEGNEYDPNEKIGTGRAAEIADKGRRTILIWCQKGYIPSVRLPGNKGQYQIRVGDLITALTTPGASVEAEQSVPAQS